MRADDDCYSGSGAGRRGQTILGPDGRRRLMGFRDAEPVGDADRTQAACDGCGRRRGFDPVDDDGRDGGRSSERWPGEAGPWTIGSDAEAGERRMCAGRYFLLVPPMGSCDVDGDRQAGGWAALGGNAAGCYDGTGRNGGQMQVQQ
ncbi:hypothetical protein ACLOJK_016402 [Asimina triloba]